ncbi:NADPH:quinone oxidoreductase family protein [Dactylosporangium sp. NPDC050688]|uniref:NADPH:quinone oxidoreductase family protein n=1 Tax=Dactylosporangium sp. NPDC050688 TaxID=3157217 RepID=UPI00340A0076
MTDGPQPQPGPGQVLVDVAGAGVNFPDGLIVAGTYQTRPELPFVPGSEVAGTVAALGDGVTGPPVGTPVAGFCGIGGYAAQTLVDARMVHRLPEGVDLVEASTIPVVYGTSYHGLVDRAGLATGETLLVLGASGGVGLTAVQIGKALGATVIAAASSEDKRELCLAHGADHAIGYDDMTATVRELTGGADVVYDPVGGDAATAALRTLSWAGRFLTVGYAAGEIPQVKLNRLLLTEGAVLGVLWGAWAKRNPEANAANMTTLLEWVAAGRLRPHVSEVFPLEEAARALTTVMNRGARGKIALRVNAGKE